MRGKCEEVRQGGDKQIVRGLGGATRMTWAFTLSEVGAQGKAES